MGRRTETTSFAYESLNFAKDEIRVLRLHSSANNNGIIRKVKRYLLSLVPEYCAVSYCWVPPSGSRTISVNGCPFVVGKNLFEILRNQGFWPSLECCGLTHSVSTSPPPRNAITKLI